MKYVIMTEGPCEKALIDVLIKKGIFNIPVESLLYEEVFHARQIKGKVLEKINQLPYQEKIFIIRIGDKLTDDLVIPDDLEDRVEDNIKICIKPEFEVLHLIYKGKLDEYIKKHKSSMKPSEYLSQIDKEYKKAYDYNYKYFDALTSEKIINVIKTYSSKRGGTHKKYEKFLEELIN